MHELMEQTLRRMERNRSPFAEPFARDIRVILSEFSERLRDVLKDEKESDMRRKRFLIRDR
jgi:hypothetical protein